MAEVVAEVKIELMLGSATASQAQPYGDWAPDREQRSLSACTYVSGMLGFKS
jgi:hypothetical protein